ncbi:unnamed protein product [Onchocerca flexuosa]|uniref:PORR domain-containing protein n=1 Tax=Onchocerca flexuosa TaxID=387005 RepID=A0A183H056_9BILA|nr:unnamed protein product [Onchocerca flexuosa]
MKRTSFLKLQANSGIFALCDEKRMRLWVSTANVADLLKFLRHYPQYFNIVAASHSKEECMMSDFQRGDYLGDEWRQPMNGDNDKSRLFSLLTVEEDEVAARGDSEDEELAEFSVVLSVFESKIERSFLA